MMKPPPYMPHDHVLADFAFIGSIDRNVGAYSWNLGSLEFERIVQFDATRSPDPKDEFHHFNISGISARIMSCRPLLSI